MNANNMTNIVDLNSQIEKRGKSAVPAVEKALDVIELLSEWPDGLSMNEIAEMLGRTMGEIYRIVIYLTERKYLAQNLDTNRYTLTLRLFELSHKYDPTKRLLKAALPILERITTTISQSCHLGVLNQFNILVVASVPSPLPAGYFVRVGSLFPIDKTSSGHVILAYSSNSDQESYISSRPPDEHEILRERLDNIRNKGFEDTPSTMIHGVRNLCVPVFDARGITAAVTSGYIEQVDNLPTAEEALIEVRRATDELSRSLGFQPSNSSDFSNVEHSSVDIRFH